jgi:2-methylcitrate dehydratase PrpD
MCDITEKYVEQLQKTKFADFSPSTLLETKKAVLDTLGCMLAGINSPIGKATLKVFNGFGGRAESSIIGHSCKLPAAIAAYINAESCVGPDLSDNYQPQSVIISHPGEAVIPAVLALAEKKGSSLEDFYTAVVLGYETAGRYAKAIEPRRAEVYSFSTHYTLAAAAGCGKLLRFSDNQMKNNFGIAAALGSLPVTTQMWGFRDRPASWHRDMPGHTNFSAVIASSYAETDFKASYTVLDPKTQFFKIAGSENYKEEILFENWGENYVIDAITFKEVPS